MTAQSLSEPLRPLVELAVAHLPPAAFRRQRLGRTPNLGLEQLVQTAILPGIHDCRVIPIHQQLLTLSIGEHRQLRNVLVRLAGDRFQKRSEMSTQAPNGLSFE